MAKKTPSTSLVQFEEYDDEAVAEEQKERAAGGGGIMLKLTPGKYRLRVPPAKKGTKLKRIGYVHYVDSPGVGRVFLNCAMRMAKLPCVVCKSEAKLLSTGNAKDEAKAKKLRAKARYYMNVIDRANPEAGVKVLGFGPQINDQLVEIREDTDDGGNFSHPINGFDLKVIRKGSGMNDTEYKITAINPGTPTPLHTDAKQMNEWIDTQPNLERFLKVPTVAQQEAALRGEEVEDVEEAAPRGRQSSRTVDEEVDEVDPDAEEDEDDDSVIDVDLAD